MKSLQICLLSALLVIAASNPIPADEPVVAPTDAPAVADAVSVVKSGDQPVVPAVAAATEVPSTQKSLTLPIENEPFLGPKALPSKKEEAPLKAEEKKREVAVEQPTVQPVEAQPEQVTGKSLPERVKEVAAEASTPKVEQPQVAESAVKSVAVEQPVVPTVPAAAVIPDTKAVDVKQAVESTVVPVVPSAVAQEKKIDAESPVAIVSENVNVEPAKPVEAEPKSALPIPAGQVQDAPQQQQEVAAVPAEAQALAQPQERSAAQTAELPVVAASSVEPTAAPAVPASAEASSSASSEKKIEEDSSSSSSEESKESQEEPEKKQA